MKKEELPIGVQTLLDYIEEIFGAKLEDIQNYVKIQWQLDARNAFCNLLVEYRIKKSFIAKVLGIDVKYVESALDWHKISYARNYTFCRGGRLEYMDYYRKEYDSLKSKFDKFCNEYNNQKKK